MWGWSYRPSRFRAFLARAVRNLAGEHRVFEFYEPGRSVGRFRFGNALVGNALECKSCRRPNRDGRRSYTHGHPQSEPDPAASGDAVADKPSVRDH
jgi:hypothetical protein